jgi:SAM-dependent methyltransferase
MTVSNPKPAPYKSPSKLSEEWNRVARLRADQIESGRDLSFSYVLVPCIKKLSKNANLQSVIDIGCGAGFLTNELANVSHKVTGIDISKESIALATEKHRDVSNLEFFECSVEAFAKRSPGLFTTAVANMSLMTVIDLESTLSAVKQLLQPSGSLIFTITHPCFWPIYSRYGSEEWFHYSEEIAIEAPFKISLEPSNFITTHVHRPLEFYLNTLLDTGFAVKALTEPVPHSSVEVNYPEKWQFPRFLGIMCVLDSK